MPAIAHRLFFALQPPARQCAMLGIVRDRIADARSIVANDRLHVTLAVTDDFDTYPPSIECQMQQIGAQVATAPFQIVLDRLSAGMRSVSMRPSRLDPRLADLQRQIDRAMTRRSLCRRDWTFRPHATLVYRNGAPFQRAIPIITWEAVDFILVHSIVGATKHIELGRWPLASRQYQLEFQGVSPFAGCQG